MKVDYSQIGGFIRLYGVDDQAVWILADEIEMVAETDGGCDVRTKSKNTYHLTSDAQFVLTSINDTLVP